MIIKYSYLLQIIGAQLYTFKYSNLILHDYRDFFRNGPIEYESFLNMPS